ncbi:MAG: DGQHR domain-containing protein DpdB [Bacillota bacterium]
MGEPRRRYLKKRAMRLDQNASHPLYLFSLTAEELFGIAEISRVSRDDAGKLLGYQRPEVRKHVQEIVEYLNSDGVLFPNSLILALSSRSRFICSRGPQTSDRRASAGTLEIPLPGPSEQKPAWIVDGQQRALALSKCRRRDLVVPVNAFVADEVDLQRDQFLRINNTRALPRGLITELLPEVSCPLPARLSIRKVPAELCDLLNRDTASPFYGLIRRPSSNEAERARAVVTDTSIVKMIEESLMSPSGCLFPYRNMATGETDFSGIWSVLLTYWSAVKVVFPDAWGKPPTQSRLMHGTGIRAMGRLMDRIMGSLNVRDPSGSRLIQRELAALKPMCHWISGTWEGLGGLAWNEIENVPRHIQMLSNYLIRLHVQERGHA